MKLNGLAYARVWHLVDAKDQILGRLANKISIALRGKYKPYFNPAIDTGDYVVVINAKDIQVTGDKENQKEYFWHSGYPGGVTLKKFGRFKQEHPTGPIQKAVYGMLPKNPLRREQMKRLLIFPDEHHPYAENILKQHLPLQEYTVERK